MKNTNKRTNRLINETSPYLLQHAHNPVDWHAWNDETLKVAKEQDKMLLISVGYSACHWCHVMERESFENASLAQLMNQHFICVKVDREERPDVDAIYMNAVQLIHGNGGWPLNCFALPDGKPVYGGTYFQPQQWEVLLKNIADLYKNRRNELEQQATQILDGINRDNLVLADLSSEKPDTKLLERALEKWEKNFDLKHGGSKGAPKFPLPSGLQFILEYAHSSGDKKLMEYAEMSLDKMAMGGIYDQIGGGFARYSVDAEWKVPHFEKMLYDNAQLVTLYTIAYQLTKKQRYLNVATETADFVLRELTSEEGVFFSALDADSDGEEGKFYVWTKQEFEESLGEDSQLLAGYFEMDGEALWEQGKNVLMRRYTPEGFVEMKNLDKEAFLTKLAEGKKKLYDQRALRTRPGLDDKSLASWNAMMIRALAQLSMASGNKKYLKAALNAANLITKKMIAEDGEMHHNYKNGNATIDAFLEDYAHMADAAIELYQVTMDEKWIRLADKLAACVMNYFWDESEEMFWFTSDKSSNLVSRKKELYDNVIPSSNAMMAHVLFRLSKLYGNQEYEDISKKMAGKLSALVEKHAASFSCWARLLFYFTGNFYEVAITGKDALENLTRIYNAPVTRKVVAAAESSGSLPIFNNRFRDGKSMIYVCADHICQKPVETVDEAISQLK